MKNWFNNYIKQFEQTEGILLKAEHSFKVSNECIILAKKLNWNSWDIHIAEIVGLLHDIGRFEQYIRYHTFKDKDSVDHAKLGVKIIKKLKVLRHYDKKTQLTILKAIRNHNKPTLSIGTSVSHKFGQLLRDADKLDILRVFIEHYVKSDATIGFQFPDTPGISKNVYNSIMNHKFVKTHKIKSLNDFKVFCTAWVFDINFRPTLQEIIRRDYINFLFDSMNLDEQIEDCKKTIQLFIQKKLS